MKPERVKLLSGVVDTLVDAAIKGYEAPYKEERLGILLGRLQRNVAVVSHAKVYRGGVRTRTSADVDDERFTRRVRELCQEYDADFIGSFHSHTEVAGSITSALSKEDRAHLCSDPPHVVELIVAIWGSDHASRPGLRYIQGHHNGYRFRIAGYQMCSPFQWITVTADDVT